MKAQEFEFTLPIGYEDKDGNFHRDGRMRLATAYDEIIIYNNEKTSVNSRYRDILVLCQVITKLGDLNTINIDIIEDLYEVDFLYLQILYNLLNKEFNQTINVGCPECHNIDKINFTDLFKDIHHYYFSMEKSKKYEAKIEEAVKPLNTNSN